MEDKTPDTHKFQQASGMTLEQVYNFAFKGYISLMQSLAKELGEDGFLEVLERASLQAAAHDVQEATRNIPRRDLAIFTNWLRFPDPDTVQRLTFDVVEDTERVFEIRVTECIWAKTFREENAADIGYATVCHRDLATCQAFNPKIKLVRTKTLMQGDDCCDHRWVWEE